MSTKMVDELEQIGETLRLARERAGLEMEDVVFRTQIPRTVLESLEAEDFTAFTSPVYAKSFLSQYSEFLNVDAQHWIDALEPGSFVAGGQVANLFEEGDHQSEEEASAPEHRGGLLSVLILLTLSAAIVVGAIKGYEFFEIRFGGKGSSLKLVPPVTPPSVVPTKPPEDKSVSEKEDETLDQGTPKAIIVE